MQHRYCTELGQYDVYCKFATLLFGFTVSRSSRNMKFNVSF